MMSKPVLLSQIYTMFQPCNPGCTSVLAGEPRRGRVVGCDYSTSAA